MDFDKAVIEVCKVHKIPYLKPLQRLCLKNLVLERDVLACLPTGFGKSLVFQAWPTVCKILCTDCSFSKWPEDPVIVVVCPLMSIIEDQIRYLESIGISAACVGQNTEVDHNIAYGNFSVVFESAESLVGNKKWRKVFQTPTIYIFQLNMIYFKP